MMGTRGLVRVFDGDAQICAIYRQFDGYPDGLGRDVADFCATRRIVNGISSKYRENAITNGAGCLAALLVSELKGDRVGSVYLYAPGVEDCGQEFEYHVKCPTHSMVDAAAKADWHAFQGLPIVVEAFSVNGGYRDKPRTLERVEIPGCATEEPKMTRAKKPARRPAPVKPARQTVADLRRELSVTQQIVAQLEGRVTRLESLIWKGQAHV